MLSVLLLADTRSELFMKIKQKREVYLRRKRNEKIFVDFKAKLIADQQAGRKGTICSFTKFPKWGVSGQTSVAKIE